MKEPVSSRIIIALTAVLLQSGFLYAEQPPDGQAARFAYADALFYGRANPENARTALSMYRLFHMETPADPEAAWRLSMACYFVGFELTTNGDHKKMLFAEGRDAGLIAVKLSPGSAPAHFWTAVNMALYGQTVGVIKMIFTLHTVCGHLEDTIKCDPYYAYGGPYRILGAVNQALPRILGGDDNAARKFYEKAIETVPDEPLNYLFLARLYNQKYRDPKSALDIAGKGLKLPLPSAERYESRKALKEIEAFILSISSAMPARRS